MVQLFYGKLIWRSGNLFYTELVQRIALSLIDRCSLIIVYGRLNWWLFRLSAVGAACAAKLAAAYVKELGVKTMAPTKFPRQASQVVRHVNAAIISRLRCFLAEHLNGQEAFVLPVTYAYNK